MEIRCRFARRAVADLGKLRLRDDAILVDRPEAVVAVAHTAETQPADQQDGEDQHA